MYDEYYINDDKKFLTLIMQVSQKLCKKYVCISGDEFVVILNEQNDQEETIEALQRLLNVISLPISLVTADVFISASIGVTFYSHKNTLDAETLLRQADQAMYEAKLRGKHKIVTFEEIPGN